MSVSNEYHESEDRFSCEWIVTDSEENVHYFVTGKKDGKGYGSMVSDTFTNYPQIAREVLKMPTPVKIERVIYRNRDDMLILHHRTHRGRVSIRAKVTKPESHIYFFDPEDLGGRGIKQQIIDNCNARLPWHTEGMPKIMACVLYGVCNATIVRMIDPEARERMRKIGREKDKRRRAMLKMRAQNPPHTCLDEQPTTADK